MIIDCHCHAGEGDGLTGPWDTTAPLDRYLRSAAEAGIERTVLFPVFHSDYGVANRAVARIVASRPDRFLGFAFVHPRRDAGRVAALVGEAVAKHGFRGIKVHRHDARITREICEVARAFRIPVLYDVMGDVSQVELLATEYPTVRYIIPHLGSFADDWRAQVALIDHLARHPNVYTDTSGVRRFDLLEQAVARAGARKILFGSDGPWLHPGIELAKVRALKLSPADERLMTGGNLLRLIAGARVPRRVAARPGRRVRGTAGVLGPRSPGTEGVSPSRSVAGTSASPGTRARSGTRATLGSRASRPRPSFPEATAPHDGMAPHDPWQGEAFIP